MSRDRVQGLRDSPFTILHKRPNSGGIVFFPECFRRAMLFLLEHSVEVGEIVETTLIRNFADALCGINQHARCITQSDFI